MDVSSGTSTESAADRIAPISRQIWDAKYRLKAADGTPIDLTIEDSWRRVARALARRRGRAGAMGAAVLRGAGRISASCRPAASCRAPAATAA